MTRIFNWMIALVALAYAGLFLALQIPMTAVPEPLDAQPPKSQLADPEKALTFARALGPDDRAHVLLVTRHDRDGAMAIDLDALAGRQFTDEFAALDHFGRPALRRMVRMPPVAPAFFHQADLLPSAAGARHIAFGTNFGDHGAEVENEIPFHFPRLTAPTGSITRIAIAPDRQMIDYEVEFCMRFDRPIASLDSFETAHKAVFLCGDFTDRKLMLDGMPDNEKVLSGIGFPDAKSLPGFFPTGPYSVVPDDWQRFVEREILATTRNGALMQRANGGDMILNFREMADVSLRSGMQPKWTFRGQPVSLLPTGRLEKGQVLLSGTTGGVLFRPPSALSKIVLGAKYGMTGGFLRGKSGFRAVVDDYARRVIRAGTMLQPGDVVTHHSTHLGTIRTELVLGPDQAAVARKHGADRISGG